MMKHLFRTLALLLVVAALPAQAADFSKRSLGGRDYWVYTPTGYVPGQPLPLVVYLHGCGEIAEDVAVGTRWNSTAEANKFIVIYPDQTRTANVGKCWNWFLPNHQKRGQGEAKLIADMTYQTMAELSVDPKRVYVLGFSAGGAMSSVMGVTYPDLYAAVGMFAGCGYATCMDMFTGRRGYEAMGPNARPVPAIMFGGTVDPTYLGMLGNVTQWLGTSDLADDGLANRSVPLQAAATSHSLGNLKTHPYTLKRYNDAQGRSLLDFYTVYGATHLYYGGDISVLWTDPLGPGITPLSWAFFQAHPMP